MKPDHRTHRWLLGAFFVMCLVGGYSDAAFTEYPTSIPRCKAGDTECIRTVMNNIIAAGANGVPEFDIPAIDPFLWAAPLITSFDGTRLTLSVKLVNTNTSYVGLSHMQIVEVIGFEKNPSESAFEIRSITPRVDILANYESTAQLFGLPINGHGHSNCSLQNLETSVKLYPRIETRDGQEYVHFDKVKVNFNTTRFFMKFNPMETNQPLAINQGVNAVINDNWRDVLDDLRPSLKRHIAALIKSIVGPFFSTLPYADYFLPDDPNVAVTR